MQVYWSYVLYLGGADIAAAYGAEREGASARERECERERVREGGRESGRERGAIRWPQCAIRWPRGAIKWPLTQAIPLSIDVSTLTYADVC